MRPVVGPISYRLGQSPDPQRERTGQAFGFLDEIDELCLERFNVSAAQEESRHVQVTPQCAAGWSR